MNLKDAVEILESIFTIIAILIGGVWTYLNFVRRRIYTQRLELHVNGKVINFNDKKLLFVQMSIRNSGLSKVLLHHETSTLAIYNYPRWHYQPIIHMAVWQDPPIMLPIFHDHNWIESSEVIEEKLLIPLTVDDDLAWKVQLVVASKRRFQKSNLKWTAVEIVLNEKRTKVNVTEEKPNDTATGATEVTTGATADKTTDKRATTGITTATARDRDVLAKTATTGITTGNGNTGGSSNTSAGAAMDNVVDETTDGNSRAN